MRGPQPTAPRDSDLVSFSALQKWDAQTYGFRIPESEFRQTWESNSEGRPVKAHDFPGSSMFGMIMTAAKKHTDIPVSALVIFAIPHLQDPWMTQSSDPEIRKAAGAYFETVDALAEKQAKAIGAGVPTARVVRLRGMHYIFISNERDVLREMRTFLASLR